MALLVLLGLASEPAFAADTSSASDPAATARSLPDLHLSVSELPGETSVRVPLASDYRLYGLLSPYLLYGEYRFLRGRVDVGTGRGLLQR